MKIRCYAGSIRLRLRKSDVESLDKKGAVQEEITFGPGPALVFELKIGQAAAPHASLTGSLVQIHLPAATARHWIQSDAVAIEYEQAHGDGPALHILIEKDFPCKHQPMEDKSDTFQELA